MAPLGQANITLGSFVGRPLSVYQQAVRHLPAFVHGDADLAECNLAGGEIQDDGGFVARGRYGNADRVGQEPGVGAAEGRDGRRMAADIDELDGDHARRGAGFAIGADPADMVGQDQAADRDAGFPRPVYGAPGDVQCRNLPVPAAGVGHQERSVVAHDLQRPVDGQRAGPPVLDIFRHHADAMAVMALQVRLDQMIGDGFRLRLGAAHRGEHGLDGDFEAGVRHGRHGRTLTNFMEQGGRPQRRKRRWQDSPAF